MFDALLCDMDGTLIDTEFANASAYCEALTAHGISVDVEEFIDKYAGMSWREFIPTIHPLIDKSTCDQIVRDKKKIYKSKMSETKLKSSVIELVERLSDSKKVALVTTASKEAVTDLLSFHQLNHLFDLIITGDDVVRSKPHPEPYLIAADKLQVSIEKCIVLEDSPIGIASARAAGATVLIVDHE